MKVLYVTNMYPSAAHIYDGIHVREQIQALASKFPLSAESFIIKGRDSSFNYLKSIWKINKRIRTEKFDIIHIHFGLCGLFCLFNPFLKVPLVLTLHGSDIRPSGNRAMYYISKLVARRVNKVIIVNDKMRDYLSLPSKKIITIPCGIDTNLFCNNNIKIDSEFVIGFPGSPFRKVKNYELFNEIIEIFKARGFQASIIKFHNLTRLQVLDSLKKLGCLLMTSLSEGSPQIVKEAMALGVPVVSTNVGDLKRLLSNVTNCKIIDSFDAMDFLEPLEALSKLSPFDRRTNGLKRLKELGLDHNSTSEKIYNVYLEFEVV